MIELPTLSSGFSILASENIFYIQEEGIVLGIQFKSDLNCNAFRKLFSMYFLFI